MITLQPLTTAESTPTFDNPPWGRYELLKVLALVLVGSLALGLTVAGLVRWSGALTPENARPSSPLLFGLGIGAYTLIILGVYLFAVRRPHSSWQMVGVRGFAAGWWLAAFPLVMTQLTGMVIINTWLIPIFTGARFENPQVEAITGGLQLSPLDLLLLLVLIAVVAPIAEELFFRGMLYPIMRRRWGAGWAMVLNALVFALAHFLPVLIPGLFFVGLILAVVRERSQSVLPGILLHVLQNGIVVMGIYAVANA
jgi:hypothetical protein